MGDDVEFDYVQSRSEDDESSFEQLQQHETPPTVFNKPRHLETIKGIEIEKQSWRMKERVCHLSIYFILFYFGYYLDENSQRCISHVFECWC